MLNSKGECLYCGGEDGIRTTRLNKLQLIILWLTGLSVATLCLYPPWIVRWTLDGQVSQTVCFAPVWYGSSDLLTRASLEAFQRKHAQWEAEKCEYETSCADWEAEKKQWDQEHPMRPITASEEWYERIRARASGNELRTLTSSFRKPSPSSLGEPPKVNSVPLVARSANFTRLSGWRLILECISAIILGGLLFVTLRTR